MKVSITFDKTLKQNSKKLWIKEIQTVVDRLNKKADIQTSPKLSPNTNFEDSEDPKKSVRQYDTQTNNTLICEIIRLQNIMEDRFSGLTGSLGKLAEKLTQVEKRVAILQIKEQSRTNLDEDFDRQFAQISLKYDRLKVSPSCDRGLKKMAKPTLTQSFRLMKENE